MVNTMAKGQNTDKYDGSHLKTCIRKQTNYFETHHYINIQSKYLSK